MSLIYANNSVSHLLGDLSAGATFLQVNTGEGDLFPQPGVGEEFPVTIEDRLAGTREICLCTSRTGDQLFITRGQEGTLAQSWLTGTLVSHRVTAAAMNDKATQAQVTQLAADTAALQAQVTQLTATYEQSRIAVGGLYLTTVATDPATVLGYGTWAAHAAGRALVGVGDNGESIWTADQVRGSETHLLSEAEMPAHTHEIDPPSTNTSSDTHNHKFYYEENAGTGSSKRQARSSGDSYNTSSDTHNHSLNIPAFTSGTKGDGEAHNNVQPAIGVFVWRRVT